MQVGKTIRAIGVVVVTLVCADLAFAQAYPSGPIRMVVPFPPGGGTDELRQNILDVTTCGVIDNLTAPQAEKTSMPSPVRATSSSKAGSKR